MNDVHFGILADQEHAAKIPKEERCEWCGGTGNEFYAMYHRCPKCFGSGRKDPPEDEV